MSLEHETVYSKADLPNLYTSLEKGRIEHIILADEEEVIDKGDLEIFGQKVHSVKILPKRHDLFYTNHQEAHPDKCHDIGLTNLVVMRNLRGNPYPLDIFACRHEGCNQIITLDPISSDEVGRVARIARSKTIT